MNAQEFENKLIELGACEDAQEWCIGKSLKDAWETCERGDWMVWLYWKSQSYDIKDMRLCVGHQANTVRHLMLSQISRDAVDTAIAFGEGKASNKNVFDAYNKAYDYYSKETRLDVLPENLNASVAALVSCQNLPKHVAFHALNASKNKEANGKETANIARKYLPLPKF